MKILIATTNLGKVREIELALSSLSVTCLSFKDLKNSPAVEETGKTFAENALIKARAYAKWAKIPTLADDSGLVVPALGGDPGVYSARYAGPQATDEENLQKLIREISKIPEGSRQAYFECVLAFVTPDGKEDIFSGKIDGEIIHEKRGSSGFGYDPIFFVPQLGKTTAEISLEEKNKLSHRGKALESFLEFMQPVLSAQLGSSC